MTSPICPPTPRHCAAKSTSPCARPTTTSARFQFNTVVSAAMKMLNALEKSGKDAANRAVVGEALSILLRLLSPITPHIAHALWQELGYGDDILTAALAGAAGSGAGAGRDRTGDPGERQAARQPARGRRMPTRLRIEQLALAHEAVQKQLAGGTAKKVIVVPGRLINVVI